VLDADAAATLFGDVSAKWAALGAAADRKVQEIMLIFRAKALPDELKRQLPKGLQDKLKESTPAPAARAPAAPAPAAPMEEEELEALLESEDEEAEDGEAAAAAPPPKRRRGKAVAAAAVAQEEELSEGVQQDADFAGKRKGSKGKKGGKAKAKGTKKN